LNQINSSLFEIFKKIEEGTILPRPSPFPFLAGRPTLSKRGRRARLPHPLLVHHTDHRPPPPIARLAGHQTPLARARRIGPLPSLLVVHRA
jgi:hypothetical protein